MEMYFDNNYPKNLAEALKLLHDLDKSQVVNVIRTQNIDNIDKKNSVVFFNHLFLKIFVLRCHRRIRIRLQ